MGLRTYKYRIKLKDADKPAYYYGEITGKENAVYLLPANGNGQRHFIPWHSIDYISQLGRVSSCFGTDKQKYIKVEELVNLIENEDFWQKIANIIYACDKFYEDENITDMLVHNLGGDSEKAREQLYLAIEDIDDDYRKMLGIFDYPEEKQKKDSIEYHKEEAKAGNI